MVLAVLPACHSYRAATAPGELAEGARNVRVRYGRAQLVPVVSAGRDTLRLEATELLGQVHGVRQDTLFVRLTQVRDAKGRYERSLAASPVATVVPGPGTSVEVAHLDAGKTAGAVLIAAAAVAATVLAVFLIGLSQSELSY